MKSLDATLLGPKHALIQDQDEKQHTDAFLILSRKSKGNRLQLFKTHPISAIGLSQSKEM